MNDYISRPALTVNRCIDIAELSQIDREAAVEAGRELLRSLAGMPGKQVIGLMTMIAIGGSAVLKEISDEMNDAAEMN